MDHFHQGIQGWCNFESAYREAVANAPDPAVFVEVGCWKGRSAAFLGVEIINSGKKIELHCVDHWKGSNEPAHKAETSDIYRAFLDNMRPVRAEGLDFTVHRGNSAHMARGFEDASVDFIWIDAGHTYEDVKKDIAAWWPKLKVGGVMGGDDLPMEGVTRAVRERFPDHEAGAENGWAWWRVRKEAA